MYRKDQLKGIAALIIFGSIALIYFFFGKDIAKIFAVVGFIIWIGTMYHLNKRKE